MEVIDYTMHKDFVFESKVIDVSGAPDYHIILPYDNDLFMHQVYSPDPKFMENIIHEFKHEWHNYYR